MTETFLEDETGFSVEADAEALAAKLADVLGDDQSRRHIRSRAPINARHNFSVDAMMKATLDAYAKF